MARLTKRNQVAGRITARTSALQVMNIKHRVFRSAVTMLTNVPVSEKNVLADVPEAELFALLVLFPLQCLNSSAGCMSKEVVSTEIFVTGDSRITVSMRDKCALIRFSTDGASHPLRLVRMRLSNLGAR